MSLRHYSTGRRSSLKFSKKVLGTLTPRVLILGCTVIDGPPRWRASSRRGRWIAVLRFDPFGDFDVLTRGLMNAQTGSNRSPRFMPMDLCKVGDHYLLTADLPGVDPGSVDVDVDGGTLTISA